MRWKRKNTHIPSNHSKLPTVFLCAFVPLFPLLCLSPFMMLWNDHLLYQASPSTHPRKEGTFFLFVPSRIYIDFSHSPCNYTSLHLHLFTYPSSLPNSQLFVRGNVLQFSVGPKLSTMPHSYHMFSNWFQKEEERTEWSTNNGQREGGKERKGTNIYCTATTGLPGIVLC